jgi:hypothetical protein
MRIYDRPWWVMWPADVVDHFDSLPDVMLTGAHSSKAAQGFTPGGL